MPPASLTRRSFLGLPLAAAAAFSPLGRLIARAAAVQPVYHLPFPGGVVWFVIQGNNTAFSHNGRAAWAWDFRMPTGSPIAAARGGTVSMIKQDQTDHCFDLSCPDWNNYIVVDHGDGSSAAYLHGVKDGARVRLGQRVEQGDFLGLSDNTGQSGGPHLHFQVQHNNPGQYLSQSFSIGFAEVEDQNGIPLTRHEYRSGNARLLEFDVLNGHFYTQTNGRGGGGGSGFSVFDDDMAPLWTAYKSAGGPAAIGYPVSRRFTLSDGGGHVYQAFQKEIVDWDPAKQQLGLMNVMDLLHDADIDGWLFENYQVPLAADYSDADQGRGWDEIVKAHLALLDGNNAFKAAYNAVPDPVGRFGLPTSGIAETDDALLLRTQRVVFQLWKHDTPWAKAGQITLANVGELARDARLFSDNIFKPEQLLPEQLSGETRLP